MVNRSGRQIRISLFAGEHRKRPSEKFRRPFPAKRGKQHENIGTQKWGIGSLSALQGRYSVHRAAMLSMFSTEVGFVLCCVFSIYGDCVHNLKKKQRICESFLPYFLQFISKSRHYIIFRYIFWLPIFQGMLFLLLVPYWHLNMLFCLLVADNPSVSTSLRQQL